MAANAGFPCAATPSCHSAVDEQPMVPTFPFDHGCDDIHEMASVPSVSGAPRMSYCPSEKKWPRSFISTKAEPRFTAAIPALISLGAGGGEARLLLCGNERARPLFLRGAIR